jgi:hypothetical protein
MRSGSLAPGITATTSSMEKIPVVARRRASGTTRYSC